MKTRLVTVLTASAVIKLAAMAEWPPLYRVFLHVPANLLAFFRGSEYVESAGIYTFPDFILDYSCSGIHFFIITVLMTGVVNCRLSLALPCGFLVTLIANTFRVGLVLSLTPLAAGRPWLHEAVGTGVFLSFLIAYYFLLASPPSLLSTLWRGGGKTASANSKKLAFSPLSVSRRGGPGG